MMRCFKVFGLPLVVGWLALAGVAWADDGAAALRAAAAKLLADGSADDAVKAADLLDQASQIEAREADLVKGGTPLGFCEAVIENGLAPLISTIVLGGTLVFQIWQAKGEERRKAQEASDHAAEAREEKKRQDEKDRQDSMNETLRLLQSANQALSPAALISLQMDGPNRAQAREVAINLMHRTGNLDDFKSLFHKLYRPVTSENLDEILDFLREAHAKAADLSAKEWYKDGDKWIHYELTPDQKSEQVFQTAKRKFISAPVAEWLRGRRTGAPAALNLSQLGFEECSFAGADLRNADLEQGNWRTVNMDGCDLRGAKNIEGFWLDWSAWWRAAYIDAPFIDLLETNFGYGKPDRDWVQRMVGSLDTYNTEVAKLRAKNQG